MIQRSKPEKRVGVSAWGQDTSSIATRYEVEESDVGTRRPNYLGFGYTVYYFKSSDVGRCIEVRTDNTAWTCWFFV